MSFKMRCPKCKGLDYSIERDNRTFGAVAQAFELVFHCRCGKQMFGTNVRDEYDKQKRQYEADEGARQEEERAREACAWQEEGWVYLPRSPCRARPSPPPRPELHPLTRNTSQELLAGAWTPGESGLCGGGRRVLPRQQVADLLVERGQRATPHLKQADGGADPGRCAGVRGS